MFSSVSKVVVNSVTLYITSIMHSIDDDSIDLQPAFHIRDLSTMSTVA